MAAVRRLLLRNAACSFRLHCARSLCQPAMGAPLNTAQVESFHDRRLHVKSINFTTTKDALQKYFSFFGEVEDVKYPKTKLTNRGQGYAFVLFRDKAALRRVLRSTHVLHGRTLSVRKSLPQPLQTSRPTTAHVKNVAHVSKEEIIEHFSTFGRVVKVDLPLDMKTSQRLDYCFVHFSAPEELDAAVEKIEQELDSTIIQVDKSTSRTFTKSTHKIVAYPPVNATVESIKVLFCQFGPIQSIAMKFCYVSSESPPRPVAMVSFEEDHSAEHAAQLDDLVLDGEVVAVYKAPPYAGPVSAFHRKLFIEGLPPGATEGQIARAFERFGEVRGVVIIKNPETDRLLDWCVVTFKHNGVVDEVSRVKQHYIEGKEVRVRQTGWISPYSTAVQELSG